MTQGIYKMSFEKGDKYFPNPMYIGISINIENRWIKHKTEIKSFMDFFNNYFKYENKLIPLKSKVQQERYECFLYLVKKSGLCAKYALYIKICSFMFLNNLTINNIKFEIIKELENIEMENIHYKVEQQFLRENDFETERLGFNGPNARQFSIMSYLEFNRNNISDELKEEFIRQLNEISENFKRWESMQHSIITDWNLKNAEKWNFFVNEINIKISKNHQE